MEVHFYVEVSSEGTTIATTSFDPILPNPVLLRTGIAKVTVKRSPNIVLSVSVIQPEITPRGFVNVIVEAKRDEIPVGNLPVQLLAKGVEGTGGHAHVGGRPAGTFLLSQGRTGPNGRYATLYVASDFGGRERITAKSAETSSQDSLDLIVRVPNLLPLQSGTNHIITMHTTAEAENQHTITNSNHGTANVVARVRAAVLEYAVELGLSGNVFLAAIDMSLPSGGLFDIDGNWSPPHRWHRFGKSIDFRPFYVNTNQQIITVPIVIDGEQRGATNKVDAELLDKRFDLRGFDRFERRIGKIHYESRN